MADELVIENTKNWERLEVYNLNGELLSSHTLENGIKNKIYLENLPTGLYNVNIFKGNEQLNFKFIKQ